MGRGPMPTDDVNRLRCDDCGREFPVAGIVGPDGCEALTGEQYVDELHAAGLELFCEICIGGREVAWQMTPWQPPDDLPQFRGLRVR
jgi:hypothetical protein